MCRGCCCGTAKVPGVDHDGQLRGLAAALGADTARLRVSDCLGPCAYGNVVVVQPSRRGRAQGARPVWLAAVNDDDAADDIAAWTRAGGPGIAEAPPVLSLYEFTPPRRARPRPDAVAERPARRP
ncbi:(2Fe-2S) ferredoxin domain-containing protein [Yinghuangia seranimata]|uniref:(2Fe-2S) ferredoxin domain-containing protein n=1 Tax=Yinghuangia seranimata TaxID=408067 RepID=UPI00248A9B09|nr:(2Fe-2S) ferredoxin domain-containing protein [Yinghuangia seranimata]MDI2128416.1 (2Fe-2S) ferredoxin domain-containing protein [Yinghuangia seranimata]